MKSIFIKIFLQLRNLELNVGLYIYMCSLRIDTSPGSINILVLTLNLIWSRLENTVECRKDYKIISKALFWNEFLFTFADSNTMQVWTWTTRGLVSYEFNRALKYRLPSNNSWNYFSKPLSTRNMFSFKGILCLPG